MGDIIDELNGEDDATLMKRFGMTDTLESAKKNLGELGQLSGKARSAAADRIKRMLTPSIYPGEFGYVLEEAKAKASGKTTPGQIVEDLD